MDTENGKHLKDISMLQLQILQIECIQAYLFKCKCGSLATKDRYLNAWLENEIKVHCEQQCYTAPSNEPIDRNMNAFSQIKLNLKQIEIKNVTMIVGLNALKSHKMIREECDANKWNKREREREKTI